MLNLFTKSYYSTFQYFLEYLSDILYNKSLDLEAKRIPKINLIKYFLNKNICNI